MVDRTVNRLLLLFLAFFCLTACGRGQTDEFTVFDPKEQRRRERYGTITGSDGITIFGSGNRRASPSRRGQRGRRWRRRQRLSVAGCARDLRFMPLASADPFGGLIITDWYQPASAPDERLKVHVLILDRSLRADAVQVSVFRQVARRRASGSSSRSTRRPRSSSRTRS